jgi:hypothetical protein
MLTLTESAALGTASVGYRVEDRAKPRRCPFPSGVAVEIHLPVQDY